MASGSETKGMKAFGDQLWYRAPDDLPAGKISIPSISSYTFILNFLCFYFRRSRIL